MRLLSLFLFLLPGVFPVSIAAQPLQAIVGATLFDVENRQTVPDGVVLVQGERILAAGGKGDITIPREAEIIDVTGKYLIPGLVDAHIHLFQSGGIYTRPDAIDLREYRPYEKERQWLRENAADLLKRYLACGITSVVDVGGPVYQYGLRDSMNRLPETASVYLTGPLVSTYQPEVYQIDDPPIIKVETKEAARQLVREQLPYNPDFIKIWYIARDEEDARNNYDLVKAAIDEASKNELRVAVHATQLETARLAVKAGADFLVHSVWDEIVDDEFLAALRENEVVYCPTLVVSAGYTHTFLQTFELDPIDFSLSNPHVVGSLFELTEYPEGRDLMQRRLMQKEYIFQQMDRMDSVMFANIRKLDAAGIPIATGTDAGNIGTLHATSYFDELAAMQKAGLDYWDILLASTLNGARAVGEAENFGSLSAGKRADLVILQKHPLESLAHWQQIDWVMHRGQIIRPDTLLQPTPEDLAQQQLNAYNARNIEAFLAPYAEDVAVYNFPDQLQYRGKEQMRKTYTGLFERSENLYCELVNRIVLGNTVIDRERVTFQKGRPPLEAVAIYKIEAGEIAEVYFIRE